MRGKRNALRRRWSRATLAGLTVSAPVAVLAAFASTAHADEPVAAGEPRLMSETAEITSVVDAFDRDDPIDINLTLGFTQSWRSADIHRETSLSQPGLSTGRFVAATENVATFSQSVSTLNMGADIGIFRDLALILRLPLILSDSRELGDLNGSSANIDRLRDPQVDPATGIHTPLFNVPFKSPTRSGIDYFSVGLNWAIFNQQRDWTKPTWVVGAEGRFSVGTPLHACNADLKDPKTGNATPCPDYTGPANSTKNRDPGISRGMTGLGVHTIF